VDLLAEFPDATPDWLLMCWGPMLRTATTADTTPADTASKPVVLQQVIRGDKVVTVDDKGKENTVFVPIPAQAGYAISHSEAVFVRQLSNFKIPGFDRGGM
jgi:hypothetical protein